MAHDNPRISTKAGMRKRTETMWAIAGRWANGREFIYTGTGFTRKDAIRDHEQAFGEPWKVLKFKHDCRPVKIVVTWNERRAQR